MGLYWMRPEVNTQNHPAPGRYGWLLDFVEVKIAVLDDGTIYINRRLSKNWQGWKKIQTT